jgi:hypothetical protein
VKYSETDEALSKLPKTFQAFYSILKKANERKVFLNSEIES